MGGRFALLIASSDYKDSEIRKLRGPCTDISKLQDVLSREELGNFEVKLSTDDSFANVQVQILQLFDGRSVDDLLLLYYAGHGIKNDYGDLFLTTVDTKKGLLTATAIPATYITKLMEQSRARQQIIILDCCYSGAFKRGWIHRGENSVNSGEVFSAGKGHVILTASDEMQYAWEDEELTPLTKRPEAQILSVFTRAIVEGIENGDADSAGDGLITADELCEYVSNRVRAEQPDQNPKAWFLNKEGQIVVAANPRAIAAQLPSAILELMQSEKVSLRRASVIDLEALLDSDNPKLSAVARKALSDLSEDDSKSVSGAAAAALRSESLQMDTQPSEDISSPLLEAIPVSAPVVMDYKGARMTNAEYEQWRRVRAFSIYPFVLVIVSFGLPFAPGGIPAFLTLSTGSWDTLIISILLLGNVMLTSLHVFLGGPTWAGMIGATSFIFLFALLVAMYKNVTPFGVIAGLTFEITGAITSGFVLLNQKRAIAKKGSFALKPHKIFFWT